MAAEAGLKLPVHEPLNDNFRTNCFNKKNQTAALILLAARAAVAFDSDLP